MRQYRRHAMKKQIPRVARNDNSRFVTLTCCNKDRLAAELLEHQFDLIDKTPSPVFSRFDRAHDGVLNGVKMFGGVLVFRRIAAADVSALHAKAEVDPGIAHLQALFATLRFRVHVMDVIEVGAFRCHVCLRHKVYAHEMQGFAQLDRFSTRSIT
jgi:hypothetical protein